MPVTSSWPGEEGTDYKRARPKNLNGDIWDDSDNRKPPDSMEFPKPAEATLPYLIKLVLPCLRTV